MSTSSKRIGSISLWLLVLTVLSAAPAWAAGLWMYEAATPDMGTAAAGRAALASDASTAGANPAGMRPGWDDPAGTFPTDPGTPDGQIKIEDDDVGYGFNLEVLIEAREGTRFGITYQSEVGLEFKDVAELRG